MSPRRALLAAVARRRRRPEVVLPDGQLLPEADPEWSDLVLRARIGLELAEARLEAARRRAASRHELLALTGQAKRNRLAHAAALLRAGGEVSSELHEELIDPVTGVPAPRVTIDLRTGAGSQA